MPNLTKNNASLHCRTCLMKLSVKEEETKYSYVDIKEDSQLQSIMEKYIGNDELESSVEFYPQKICQGCFKKLQQVDSFLQQAKEVQQKLRALFGSEKDAPGNEFNDEESSPRDPYKLLFKDSLMETESVLLDNTELSSHVTADVNNPDPFSNSANAFGDKNRPKLSMGVSESEKSDDEPEWTPHSLSDVSYNESSSRRKKITRSKLCYSEDALASETENDLNDLCTNSEKPATRSRAKHTSNLERLLPTAKKKKRRTKKEMEEFRRRQLEREESKNKRRQKGTKNNFKCTKCNHCFAHKITLDAHIRKIHEGNKRPFRCDRCDKSYTFIGGLYTHIKEIHEAEVRSYACDFPDCDRIYTSFIAMQKHKRVKHTDSGEQKKYVCEQCGATFNQTGNLKYHRRTKHPTEDEKAEKELEKQRYECTICKKLFHSRYTLKYHTLQLHTNETKYECPQCGRKMAKKFMLVQHMLVHSTEKMPCEHCGKQFIRKFELEAHIRAVHMKLKPFECQYCSECFASRKTLRHHEYIHTGEKPYVCDICGQAYRQQTCLKNHRKSHEKMGNDTPLGGSINRSLISSIIKPESTEANLEPTPSVL